jgi:hypothetical protein
MQAGDKVSQKIVAFLRPFFEEDFKQAFLTTYHDFELILRKID